MERNPFRWPNVVLGGELVLLGELFFTGQAYCRWPGRFSPTTNFHSDLGRTVPGPRGANTPLGRSSTTRGRCSRDSL